MRRGRGKWRAGDHWIIDDISGQKILRSEARMTWDGYLTHKNKWYPRHPQLDIKGRDEQISVPDTRPRQPDTFFTPTADDL